MQFRFRRSVKLAPGIRLNFGKRSLSTSFGPRGAQITTGTHGTRATAGAPGTGLSWTAQQKANHPRTARALSASGEAASALAKGLATVLWILFASLLAAVLRNRR
jgi:hypothetical protein